MKQRRVLSLWAGTCILLTGCYNSSRLQDIGDYPPLTRTQDPTAYKGYKPVITPQPHPQPPDKSQSKASLWQTGARAFFKDQRASRVGDVVTVIVDINDSATIKNDTNTLRQDTRYTGIPNFWGMENWGTDNKQKNLGHFNLFSPNGVSIQSNPQHVGSGLINRQEQVYVSVAALVTQVLPNGNLVISGRQEMRFNFEIREVLVTGVVRPEDILANNTIASQKIAELRVAYGGRGQLTDAQEAPYGQQVWDMVMPF